jgi:hypothetical protein
VRELIINFEKENGMASKVETKASDDIEREFSEDMSQDRKNIDDKEEK